MNDFLRGVIRYKIAYAAPVEDDFSVLQEIVSAHYRIRIYFQCHA